MKKKSILIFVLLINILICQGQKIPTFDIVSGFGLPDAFHLGIKAHIFERNQFGIYYGSNLNLNNWSYNSISLDHQLHFGKTSEFSKRKVWFFKQVLTYSTESGEFSEIKFLFLNFGIGREINISQKTGFSIDIGLFHTLLENVRMKDHSPLVVTKSNEFFVLPNIRLQFFYSL
ncbi:MAG: hypothetical protein HXX16_20290 [Bacteroidales bacterium]|nr:hypothetical protein [Bacteroidales bacterium]